MGAIGNTSSMSGRVLKAMSVFGSIQVLGLLCTVIRTKIIALWTGTLGVGIWSLYVSTLELLRTAGALSINQTAVPEIAGAEPSRRPDMCHITRRMGMKLGLWFTVVTILLSPWLSKVTFGNYDYTWGFILLSPAIYFNSVQTAWQSMLQGLGRLRSLARAAMLTTLTGTACAVVIIYFMGIDGIVPVMLAYAVLQYVFLAREGVERPSVPVDPSLSREVSRRLLRSGISITSAIVVTLLADYLLRVWLNSVASTETVGLFQAGANIIKSYVGMIFVAIGMEFFPRVASVARKPRTTQTIVNHELMIVMAILAPVIVIFTCCDRLALTVLYSDEFLQVSPLLLAAIPSTIFRAVSWCMAVVILARSDSRVYFLTELSSAVALLIFSYIGWTLWGLTGLGAAITAQYVAYTLATGWVFRRRYGLRIKPRIVACIALTAVIAVAAIALRITVGALAPLILLVPMAIAGYRYYTARASR